MTRLGRRYIPDARDAQFPMGAVTGRRETSRNARYWRDDLWVGNQGYFPHCVGFAWSHWLESGPVFHPNLDPPAVDPADLYFEAQKVDEWPGTDYSGTSVRAGAKVLKQLGFIESYHWARKLWEVVEALLYEGPVVLGTDWFVKMSRPNKWNVMRARGGMQGGHAYLATGVHVPKQLIRIRNSWGTGWGLNGRAWIRFRDMKKLLKRQGEACLAKEVSKKTAMQQLRETCLNAEVAPPTAEASGNPAASVRAG